MNLLPQMLKNIIQVLKNIIQKLPFIHVFCLGFTFFPMGVQYIHV